MKLSVTSPLLKEMDSRNYLYNLIYFITHYIWTVLKTRLRHCLIEYLGMCSSRSRYYSLFNSVGFPLLIYFPCFQSYFCPVNYKLLCLGVALAPFLLYLDALFQEFPGDRKQVQTRKANNILWIAIFRCVFRLKKNKTYMLQERENFHICKSSTEKCRTLSVIPVYNDIVQ